MVFGLVCVSPGKNINLFLNCVLHISQGATWILESLHLRLCPVPAHPQAGCLSQQLATAAAVLFLLFCYFLQSEIALNRMTEK